VYSRTARSHTSGILTFHSLSHFHRTHAQLVVSLPAYSRSARSLAVSVMPLVDLSQSPLTPCVGSLFSRYLSLLVWSPHGLLTHLVWARCSRGIRHSWCGLLTVFSHALCGLVVLAVSVRPGVVSSRSSHMPCVGSLFLSGVVVAVLVHG